MDGMGAELLTNHESRIIDRGLIYLASPYTHPLLSVREERFVEVCRAAARLMAAGAIVFSPIAHSHPISLAGDLPTHWEYWEQYDRMLLAAAAELWVLTMDGWLESKGVRAEIVIATELGKKIVYLDARTLEVCGVRGEAKESKAA
jgi:hypothetical protein